MDKHSFKGGLQNCDPNKSLFALVAASHSSTFRFRPKFVCIQLKRDFKWVLKSNPKPIPGTFLVPTWGSLFNYWAPEFNSQLSLTGVETRRLSLTWTFEPFVRPMISVRVFKGDFSGKEAPFRQWDLNPWPILNPLFVGFWWLFSFCHLRTRLFIGESPLWFTSLVLIWNQRTGDHIRLFCVPLSGSR